MLGPMSPWRVGPWLGGRLSEMPPSCMALSGTDRHRFRLWSHERGPEHLCDELDESAGELVVNVLGVRRRSGLGAGLRDE